MTGQLAAFVGVSLVVIVTPGPDTVLTIRNALLGGRRAGTCTALGVVTGQALWTLATSVGLAALLAASRPAFTAIRLAGAAYLVFLGARGLWHALRGEPSHDRAAGVGRPPPGVAAGVALRQGVISNLGNPKSAVFFTSLLPQFTPAGDASFAALLLLGLVYCCLTLLWLTAYAVVVARAGRALRRPVVRRVLDGITGAVLLALGLRLAVERR